MYNLSDLWDHSRLAEVGHLVFPTRLEGEAIKFVYLRTACRSLVFLKFQCLNEGCKSAFVSS